MGFSRSSASAGHYGELWSINGTTGSSAPGGREAHSPLYNRISRHWLKIPLPKAVGENFQASPSKAAPDGYG